MKINLVCRIFNHKNYLFIYQKDEPNDEKEANATNVYKFWRYYLKLDHDEIAQIAHQPKDMIIGCIYSKQVRQKDPRCTDFLTKGGIKIFTPSYGVCYMFNFKGLSVEKHPAVTFYPGEEYGLQLTINVESKLKSVGK